MAYPISHKTSFLGSSLWCRNNSVIHLSKYYKDMLYIHTCVYNISYFYVCIIYIYICVSYCVIYPTVWSLSQHVSPFLMDFFYGEISWNPQDFPPARHPGHQGSRLKPCASSWTLLRKCRALPLDVLKYPPGKKKGRPWHRGWKISETIKTWRFSG